MTVTNLKSRRFFLKTILTGVLSLAISKMSLAQASKYRSVRYPTQRNLGGLRNLGVDEDSISRVYIARGSSPEENIKQAVSLMGGIEKFIGKDDIVIIKPNAQWWNHGTTNTNNIKGFIELVLGIPGFKGEIIIAENHHYKKLDSRGWTTDQRNGDYNLNELIQHFQSNGNMNVTKYHWVDGGANPNPQEGDGGFGSIVSSVSDGDGYVWLNDSIYISPENRRCMMTYPVFTSAYSGKKIDLRMGTLNNGKYLDNLKLINFSCLNHHGTAFGVTASIKNLMGIPDMTCGYHGTTPKNFFNMHFIGSMSKLYKLGTDIKFYGKRLGLGDGAGKLLQLKGEWKTQYTGGALGFWMKTVRMPRLNILAAEYVGWGGRGREGPFKRHHANCVAISTDPVALDYVGAKEILLPSTPENEKVYRRLNDPELSPLADFLKECHNQGVGNIARNRIKIIRDTDKSWHV